MNSAFCGRLSVASADEFTIGSNGYLQRIVRDPLGDFIVFYTKPTEPGVVDVDGPKIGRRVDGHTASVGRAFTIAEGWNGNLATTTEGELVVTWGGASIAHLYRRVIWADQCTIPRTPPVSLCAPVPQESCQMAASSDLQLLDNPEEDALDRLAWRWSGAGGEVEFGDPFDTTYYSFCIYDQPGGLPRLAAAMEAAAGGGSCFAPSFNTWQPTSSGLNYTSKLGSPHGIVKMRFKSAPNGRRLLAKGKGAKLRMPEQSLVAPITVQMVNSDGQCWESNYTPAEVSEMAPRHIQARSRR